MMMRMLLLAAAAVVLLVSATAVTPSAAQQDLYYSDAASNVTQWDSATWAFGRLPCAEDTVHLNSGDSALRINTNTRVSALRLPRNSALRLKAGSTVALAAPGSTDNCPNVEGFTAQFATATIVRAAWRTTGGSTTVSVISSEPEIDESVSSQEVGNEDSITSRISLSMESVSIAVNVTSPEGQWAYRKLDLGPAYAPAFWKAPQSGVWSERVNWYMDEAPCEDLHVRAGTQDSTGAADDYTISITADTTVRSLTVPKSSAVVLTPGTKLTFKRFYVDANPTASPPLPSETCSPLDVFSTTTTTTVETTTTTEPETTPTTTTTATTTTRSGATTTIDGNVLTTSGTGSRQMISTTSAASTMVASTIDPNLNSSTDGPPIIIIAGAAGGFVVLLIIIIILVVCCKRSGGSGAGKKGQSSTPMFSNFQDFGDSSSKSTGFSSYYGPVLAISSSSGSAWKYTLNKNASSSLKECFNRDIRAFQLLNNEPLFQMAVLAPIQTDPRRSVLVLPETPQRLVDHLRKSRATFNAPEGMTEREQMKVVESIAGAVAYLLQRNIFCNCVRCESIVYDQGEQMWKLSLVGHNGKLLADATPNAAHLNKWIAPELLQSSKITERAIVWSCGIFLWEVLSFGATPASTDVYRPPARALHMSEALYGIVVKACDSSPSSRPTLGAFRSLCSSAQTTPERKKTSPSNYLPYSHYAASDDWLVPNAAFEQAYEEPVSRDYLQPTRNTENPYYSSATSTTTSTTNGSSTRAYEVPTTAKGNRDYVEPVRNDNAYYAAVRDGGSHYDMPANGLYDSADRKGNPAQAQNEWDSSMYDVKPEAQGQGSWDEGEYDTNRHFTFVSGKSGPFDNDANV